jgi:glycosyltransferase involved in cell wall biosynthesis
MSKVLHLLSRFDIGGTERQLVERLRRHPVGFEPVVACFQAWGAFLEPVRSLGLEPHVFPVRGLTRPATAWQALKIAELIRKQGIPVVHANDFATAVVGLAAARMAGARFITNRVDLGHLRPGFGKWHRQLEMLVARNADLVCANAEAVRQLCIAGEGCDPERVVVIRNGIDLTAFDELAAREPAPLPIAPGDFAVAMIGNLWPVKGHRILLEAAAKLRDRHPQLKFLCAGEGSERPYLEKRIPELGLQGRVVLLGHRTDVPALLARVNALCLCSSGNPELLEEGRGLLVPYGDVGALEAAIDRLVSDPQAAREMGTRGRAFVERELSLERMQRATEELYRRAIRGADRRTAAREAA